MDDFALVTQLADLADQITSSARDKGQMEVSLKSDGSPVTDADLAVETRFGLPAGRLAGLVGDRPTARPSWGSQVPNGA